MIIFRNFKIPKFKIIIFVVSCQCSLRHRRMQAINKVKVKVSLTYLRMQPLKKSKTSVIELILFE